MSLLLLLSGGTGSPAYSGAVTEAASATDAVSALLNAPVSITESGSASDSSSAVFAAAQSVTEAANATDSETSSQPSASIVEAASASDTASGAMSATASVTEAASATSVEVGAPPGLVAVTEAANATESSTALSSVIPIVESANATETSSASFASGAASSVQEAANAQEASFTSRFLINPMSFNNRYRDNFSGIGVDQYALPYVPGGSPVRVPEINGGFSPLLYDLSGDPGNTFVAFDALSGDGVLYNRSSAVAANPMITLKSGLGMPLDVGFEGISGFYYNFGRGVIGASGNPLIQVNVTSQQGSVVGGPGPSLFFLSLFNYATTTTWHDGQTGNATYNVPAGPALILQSSNRFGNGTAQYGVAVFSLNGYWATDGTETLDMWLEFHADPLGPSNSYGSVEMHFKSSNGAFGFCGAISLANDPGLFTNVSTSIFYQMGVSAFFINRIAGVDFIGTPLIGYKPLTVSFTDLSYPLPESWAWDFGDGNTSTAQNPINLYANAGVYTVTLTATQSSIATPNTKVAYVTVLDNSGTGGGGGGGNGAGGSVAALPRFLVPPPPVLPVAYIIEVDEKFS